MISWSLGPLFSEMPLFQRVKEKNLEKKEKEINSWSQGLSFSEMPSFEDREEKKRKKKKER